MLLLTLQFSLKKKVKGLSSVEHFDTGFWILSGITSILEGINQWIVKYLMEKSCVCYVDGRTTSPLRICRAHSFTLRNVTNPRLSMGIGSIFYREFHKSVIYMVTISIYFSVVPFVNLNILLHWFFGLLFSVLAYYTS